MSASKIKKKSPVWNTSPAAYAIAAVLDSTPEMTELLDLGGQYAKRCVLCNRPAFQVGVYTPSVEEFSRWRVGRFVVALCFDHFTDPERSKQKLFAHFDKLAELNRSRAHGDRVS